ncbi:MAG: HD domain-containing protein [Spirochaetia bacterium]|nr:HD domain-containing protein [Spirochaetales bacterium]MDX9784576.1 HD domain-containing protein [Spirochaetia bacterium]
MDQRKEQEDSMKAIPQNKSPEPVAAIEIGSTGIRLLIASIDETGLVKVLDRAGKPSRIGRDVFTSGSIGREAIRESVAVLLSFRELLHGYGIEPDRTKVIATSALREAANRDTFLDRVQLQTGFKIRVVEDIEENHLMYLAVQQALQDERKYLSRSNAMILEVGGGTTEIMLLRRGKMVSSHSLHIGTLRLEEQMREAGASKQYLQEYLESNIKNACDLMTEDIPLESIKSFIVVGSDARLAAYYVSGKNYEGYTLLDRSGFMAFAQAAASMSVEELIASYHLPWAEAEGLGPGLLIESLFLARTGAEELIVPKVSIREGLLLADSKGLDPAVEEELRRQIVASAQALGKRFHYDEAHAHNVASLSVRLFDSICDEHGMKQHERLLLETAAILHDIGTYIRSSGHHRHGEYIVSNSEVFGLNRSDINIVSNVVRYHRRTPPSPVHVNYISLPREDRITVMKLSAILRVADALDRNHTGRMYDARFEKNADRLIIRSARNFDFSLERLSLADKGDLFEDVFGLPPIIV